MLKGREGQLGAASSRKEVGPTSQPPPMRPDSAVSDKKRHILDTLINEVIVYKDAVAGVINKGSKDYYYIRFLEDGQWLNAGEDMGASLDESARSSPKSRALL